MQAATTHWRTLWPCVCAILAATAYLFAQLTNLAVSPAFAGSNSKFEQAQREAERAREQQRQERERQRQERERQQQEQEAAKKAQQQENAQKSDKNNKPANATKKAKQDDDDDDDNDNDKALASNGKKSSGADKVEKADQSAKRKIAKDAEDDKVPDTVVEWLQKLTKSTPTVEPEKPQKTSTKNPEPKAESKEVTQVKPQSGPAQNAATKAQPTSRAKPIELPTLAFARPELLATRLSPSVLTQAQKLGFKNVGTVSMASAGISATRLAAPDGLTAEAARQMLQRLAPDGVFDDNKKYRIFRTATGVASPQGPEKAVPARPMATPCGSDRCYGGSIIKWTTQHQSCAAAVRVGVIDTGFDATHPALRQQQIQTNRPQRTDATSTAAEAPNWHGTGVLGLLAGDPKSATPGLIPNARFLVSDIFFADADGQPASDTASLIQALDWLDKRGAQIVNMSLSGPHDDLLKQAIAALSRKGIMFVAAAGNDGPTAPPSYPAAYDTVIAVTAVNNDLRNYRHASRGDHIDLSAPGVDIWAALPGERAGYHSGTSFAVPYVTAVLASMYRSLANKNKPEFLRQVQTADLGPPGRDPIYGQGLVLAPTSCGPPPAQRPSIAKVSSVTPRAMASPASVKVPVSPASLSLQPVPTR
jgi:minor extracellular protease Epr